MRDARCASHTDHVREISPTNVTTINLTSLPQADTESANQLFKNEPKPAIPMLPLMEPLPSIFSFADWNLELPKKYLQRA